MLSHLALQYDVLSLGHLSCSPMHVVNSCVLRTRHICLAYVASLHRMIRRNGRITSPIPIGLIPGHLLRQVRRVSISALIWIFPWDDGWYHWTSFELVMRLYCFSEFRNMDTNAQHPILPYLCAASTWSSAALLF